MDGCGNPNHLNSLPYIFRVKCVGSVSLSEIDGMCIVNPETDNTPFLSPSGKTLFPDFLIYPFRCFLFTIV